MRNSLGLLVKGLRDEKGLTQEELAEKSNLSLRAIQRIEAGETTKPQQYNLRRLAAALEIDVYVLQEACRDEIASDAAQTPPHSLGNNETVTQILRDSTEATAPARTKRNLIQKVIAGIVIASFLMFAVYAFILNPWIHSSTAKPAVVKPVLISGKVLCANSEPVVNIWFDVFKGSDVNKGISGYADLRPSYSNGSEMAFEYVLQGDAYNLHVGCGGSKQHWKGVYITEIGSGPVHDHKFHYFICHDVPPTIDYGSCELQY